jgi:hypothetical protein
MNRLSNEYPNDSNMSHTIISTCVCRYLGDEYVVVTLTLLLLETHLFSTQLTQAASSVNSILGIFVLL